MWEYTQLRWGASPYVQDWRLDGDTQRTWENMIIALNELGHEGWEAVSIVSMPSAVIGSPLSEYVLLKRAFNNTIKG